MANSFFEKTHPRAKDTWAPTHQNIGMDLSQGPKQSQALISACWLVMGSKGLREGIREVELGEE